MIHELLLISLSYFAYGSEDIPEEGSLCMTIEHYRAGYSAQSYFRCTPLPTKERTEYQLDDIVGTWQSHTCPGEHVFDFAKQGCTNKSQLRRQQSNCQLNPNGFGCQRACQASNFEPQTRQPCNWLTASLQANTVNDASFLQCVPKQSRPCGEWIPRQCAPGTVFDAILQICIPQNLIQQNPYGCPSGTMPVSQCGQETFSCPGRSQCTEEYQLCCQQAPSQLPPAYVPRSPIPVVNNPNQAPPVCPGDTTPVSACSSSLTCPPGSLCYTVSGYCCSTVPFPLPIPVVQQPQGPYPGPVPVVQQPQGPIPVVQRPVEGPIPVVQQPQQIGPVPVIQRPTQLVIQCPNGQPGTQPCGFMEQCPAGSGCYRGVCCTLVCPSGLDATGFCGKTSSMSCPQQSSCMSGCCCQQHEPIRMPICRSGVTSTSRCSINQDCGPGMECSSGGCCPIPFCPTGMQAVGRCPSGTGCPPMSICANGLCCPSPRCSSGVIALRICVSSSECGNGFECANGGCCPLPLCANNQIGSQRCGAGGCCCPAGQQCLNNVCCPLPACSNGILAATICSDSPCPQGMECNNGGCCPLPLCPSGAQPSRRCQGGLCPNGEICENGVCCQRPVCSDGLLAVQICSFGNTCPVGYVCEGRGCCLEPMPLCPNGGRAIQRCNRGVDCPQGFGCTSSGGCCMLSLEQVCPSRENAICQCSPTSGCPPQASCNMGTCCASVSLRAYEQVPGASCQAASQCNGYKSNIAQCMQSTCICINGAASNGATCQQFDSSTLEKARSGCDQYGSPCKFSLSTARRKPIFAPIGNITEEPLWYTVATQRRCLLNATGVNFDPDSTCLPNEKCVNGECRMKLWPGEYGCASDTECSSRCPSTYCAPSSDKGISQCQCTNAKLLYGRCFKQCPAGFHANGAYCKHDDEDHFWRNSNQQNSLRELLNSGIC